MSDTTTPSASDPVAPPVPTPSPVDAPPVNPYVSAPAAPQVAPNPFVSPGAPAEAYAPGAYQPVPTSPPPTALAPYSTSGVAYAYAPRTNPVAITSLVLSLAGILTWITAIGGVIAGHIALSQIKRTGEGGRGMAIAGLVVGYVLSGFFLLYVLLMVFVFIGLSSVGSY